MNTFKQISEDEWKPGDYRPAAETWCYADEFFPNIEVVYFEYEEEGLGKTKAALFLTSDSRQFLVKEYLEGVIPLSAIWILNDKNTWATDFEQTLQLLNLKRETLTYIFEW